MPILAVTFRRVVRVVLAVTCLAGALLAPAAAHAGPVTGWNSRDLPGLDLGLPSTNVPSVVLHRGEIYAALRARNAILVRRYDRELEAWLPVGGPIAHTLNARATQPRLVSEHDELHLTYTELDYYDRPDVIVARLVERGPRSSWQIAQPLAGSAASLVHVGHDVWAVWHGRGGQVHLAQLQEADGTWHVSPTTLSAPALSAPALSRPDAVEYQGAIYVVYHADHAWRPSVGSRPTGPLWITRGAIVERVDVTRDPDARSDLLETLAIPDAHITTAQLTPVPGGRPLLTWGYERRGEHFVHLHFEELSIDPRRFLPIGHIHLGRSGSSPTVVAAADQEILIANRHPYWPTRLYFVQRRWIQDPDQPPPELVGSEIRGDVNALLLPRREVLTIAARRHDYLRAQLHTSRTIAPPDPH